MCPQKPVKQTPDCRLTGVVIKCKNQTLESHTDFERRNGIADSSIGSSPWLPTKWRMEAVRPLVLGTTEARVVVPGSEPQLEVHTVTKKTTAEVIS